MLSRFQMMRDDCTRLKRSSFLNWNSLSIGCSFLLLGLLLLPVASAQFQVEKECFCKSSSKKDKNARVSGLIDGGHGCECSLHSVDLFNNDQVFPLLKKLLQRDFFKFYKVNMEKPCPFWPDDRQCSSKECTIGYCDDEVPPAFHQPSMVRNFANSKNVSNASAASAAEKSKSGEKVSPMTGVAVDVNAKPDSVVASASAHSPIEHKTDSFNVLQISEEEDLAKEGDSEEAVSLKGSPISKEAEKSGCESSNRFDPLDWSLSEGDRAQLRDMDIFEDTEYNFCDVEDEFSVDMHYVNLMKNPERYTGYKGDSAVKVWQSIYQENCFKPNPKFDKDFLLHPTNTGLCLEKRVFYRLISGLHTAITISIASHNYKPAPAGFGEGTWFRNFEMFKGRFGTKWSKEGPERLKNLYFAYMLELRALVKVAPYLQTELFYTGNEVEDLETRQLVDNFMDLLKSYPEQFDETQLFTGFDAHARSLREEFRQHFVNISRIMDCVGCDKCRLWGKLQTHGMGTALKILFSELPSSVAEVSSGYSIPMFKLTRNEVVALFQSFGRYASSIWEINEFRQGMAPNEIMDCGM